MLDELTAILSADLPSQDDPEKLIGILYGRCYVRSILEDLPEAAAEENLTGALAAANRGRAMWVEGWTVEQTLEDGRIVARKDGAERSFLPGEYVTHRGPGFGPKKGGRITVYVLPGSSDVQDSFYHAFGETVAVTEAQRVLRFYWNIRPEGAPRLMECVTREL